MDGNAEWIIKSEIVITVFFNYYLKVDKTQLNSIVNFMKL